MVEVKVLINAAFSGSLCAKDVLTPCTALQTSHSIVKMQAHADDNLKEHRTAVRSTSRVVCYALFVAVTREHASSQGCPAL